MYFPIKPDSSYPNNEIVIYLLYPNIYCPTHCLFLKHNNPSNKYTNGKLIGFGGGYESSVDNNNLLNTAKRELREELKVVPEDLNISRPFGTIDIRDKKNRKKTLVQVMKADLWSTKLDEFNTGEGITKYLPLSHISSNPKDFIKSDLDFLHNFLYDLNDEIPFQIQLKL